MSVSDLALALPLDTNSRRASAALRTAVRALAFWLAVLLPLGYLPLLAAGLDSTTAVLTFLGLVAANVCALVVGQPYRR